MKKQETILNIGYKKRKIIVKPELESLRKYNHLFNFKIEQGFQSQNNEFEVEYFEFYIKNKKRNIKIFDYDKFNEIERQKFNTLFYMVYLYRIEDFRHRIARHETEFTIWDDIANVENNYIQKAVEMQKNLINLLLLRQSNFKNVSVSFRTKELMIAETMEDDTKIQFNGISAKFIANASIEHVINLLSLLPNNYVDMFYYFCHNGDNISIDKVKNELSRIPNLHKQRKKGHEVSNFNNYRSFLIQLIQNYIINEYLTINNQALNTGNVQLLCCQLLMDFGFIAINKLQNSFIDTHHNQIDEKRVIDFIRKLNPSATSNKGKENLETYWDLNTFLQTNVSITDIYERYPNFLENFNEYSKLTNSKNKAFKNDKEEIIVEWNP